MPKRYGKGKGKARVQRVPANPPQFMPITSFRRKFRFTASAGNAWLSGCLNEGQLLAMPGTMCTVVNTTVVAMQVSVKIHKVTIWGVPPAANTFSTVSIRYFGTAAVLANEMAAMLLRSDTSTNPAQAPVVSYAPPKGSRASFWMSADNSGSDLVLAIDANVGSVIEFDLEFNHGMPPAVGSFTTAVSSGTLGVMYWLSLTAASGTGSMTPVGLATTA